MADIRTVTITYTEEREASIDIEVDFDEVRAWMWPEGEPTVTTITEFVDADRDDANNWQARLPEDQHLLSRQIAQVRW